MLQLQQGLTELQQQPVAALRQGLAALNAVLPDTARYLQVGGGAGSCYLGR